MQKFLPCTGITLLTLLFLVTCDREIEQAEPGFTPVSIESLIEIPPARAQDEFGFDEKDYQVESAKVRRNESIYLILRRYDITPQQIDSIQRAASEHANISRLRPGQDYHVYVKQGQAVALVWNIDRRDYLVIDWEDNDIRVIRNQFEIRKIEKTVEGTIEHSLYLTLQQEGFSQLLGAEIAEIFAWQIDFFSLRPGDSFKAVYDELYIGDEFYGIGRVHTAEFKHRGEPYRAYYFENDSQAGYFDEQGNSMHKALLKAPFRYDQRVSSGFSNNRLHPILRERRPHHGVDYAAPRGTPIIAVGDGVVTEARRRGGNGNIVQIRHNSTYKTAYLHLNGFASGIRTGENVEQGQVIGYVGMTGLATGYHLCYRLYVNDQAVNSLTVDLPASESLDEEYMVEFNQLRYRHDRQLAAVVPELNEPESFSSVVAADGKN